MKNRILSVFLSFFINLAISTILIMIEFQCLRYKKNEYEMTWGEALLYCLIFLCCSYILFLLLEATSQVVKNNRLLIIVVGLICGVVPITILKCVTFGVHLSDPFEATELTIFALSGILIPVLISALNPLLQTNKKLF